MYTTRHELYKGLCNFTFKQKIHTHSKSNIKDMKIKKYEQNEKNAFQASSLYTKLSVCALPELFICSAQLPNIYRVGSFWALKPRSLFDFILHVVHKSMKLSAVMNYLESCDSAVGVQAYDCFTHCSFCISQ